MPTFKQRYTGNLNDGAGILVYKGTYGATSDISWGPFPVIGGLTTLSMAS